RCRQLVGRAGGRPPRCGQRGGHPRRLLATTGEGGIVVNAPAPARRRHHVAMVAVLSALALLAAMWIYIFFFADTNNPNRLPDQAWTKQAEPICKGYADQIKKLPDATTFANIKPKAEAMRQRAVVGQQVTDLLTAMVAQLRATPPADAVSADAVNR